jgi:fatty-acyl-CoA synthase
MTSRLPANGSGRTLPGQLIEHARTRGDVAALHVLSDGAVTTLTWAQLLRRSAGYAEQYRRAGVGPGEVVMLCLTHGPSLYPAYLGAMLAAAIPSFVSFPTPKQDPVRYWDAHRVLFDRVQAPVALTYAENAPDLAKVLPAATTLLVDEPVEDPADAVEQIAARYRLPDPGAAALLQHSSGTTGHKKAVLLSHANIASQVASYARTIGLSSASRIASWLPLYHDMGLLTGFLMPVHLGATVVSLGAFDWVERPHSLLAVMADYACDYAWLPNFAFNHLVRTKAGNETYQLAHVRAFISSSEPCRADSFAEFASTFAAHGVRPEQLLTSYAMAEAVFAVTQSPLGQPPARRSLGAGGLAGGRAVAAAPGPGAVTYLSNGRPIDGVEARVDPAAEQLPGEGAAIGELQLRGEFVFDGYYRNPQATADAFTGDGWYRTGDLGTILDGELYVLGRSKDVIIHHGVNYYAHDLEAVAATVSGVKPGRCAAVAVYDDEAGSDRIELIAERDPATAASAATDAELRAALRQAIADRFPVTLARVHLVEPGWLVKTTSGKVSRADNLAKLHAQPPPTPSDTDLGAGPDTGRDTSTRQEIELSVIATIASTFSVPAEQIGPDTSASDVEGWDSLGHTVLMIRLGRALGAPVPESAAARARNVGELIGLLEAASAPRSRGEHD